MKRHPHWQAMPIEQARALAATPTVEPEQGEWLLLSPSGRVYSGDSPLQCVRNESHERIPAEVALARIRVAMEDEKQ